MLGTQREHNGNTRNDEPIVAAIGSFFVKQLTKGDYVVL